MRCYRFGVSRINWLDAQQNARSSGNLVDDVMEEQINDRVEDLDSGLGPITIHNFTVTYDEDTTHGTIIYLYSYEDDEE